jgi:hypothetical protein
MQDWLTLADKVESAAAIGARGTHPLFGGHRTRSPVFGVERNIRGAVGKCKLGFGFQLDYSLFVPGPVEV